MFHVGCDIENYRETTIAMVEYVGAGATTTEKDHEDPYHKHHSVDLSTPCAKEQVDNNSEEVKRVIENWPSFEPDKHLSRNRARWSAPDQIAANRLCSFGYSERKQYEITNSGYDYREKWLGKERLYRFSSYAYETDPTKSKDRKKDKGTYWLTKVDYKSIKRECCVAGKWDREKVKQRLALPCFNRADCVVEAIVTEPHSAEYARIASCHEGLIYLMNNGDSYEYKNKPLGGGGYQTIPDLNKISIVDKTPTRLR